MRRYHWLPILLVALMVIGIVPARAEEPKIKVKNNVVTVEPLYSEEETLPTLLSDEEVAKIKRLQTEAVIATPSSSVSPDDQVVLVTSANAMAFLNINDGSSVAIPEEAWGPFFPVPMLGISSFTWLDDQTLGCLALNFSAELPQDYIGILGVHRETLELSFSPISLPDDLGIVSVSPDLTRFLTVVIPQEQPVEEALQTTKLRVGLPEVAGLTQIESLQVPSTMQARVNQARSQFAGLLSRFALMQDTSNDQIAVTEKTLDLALYNAVTGERSYVTTLPETTSVFGEAWTPDSSRLAVSFVSLRDPDAPRGSMDGALLSEILYRDATGNLAPAENPLLQNNNTYVIDTNSHAVQILRAAGPGAPPLLAADDWAPDNASLLVKAYYPAKLKGRTHPVYIWQFSERSSYRFYTKDLKQTGELNSNILSAGEWNQSVAHFVTPDEVIFRSVVGSERHPYYYNRVTGELRNLADRAGVYGAIVHTNHSREMVFIHHSFISPPDLYRMGWNGKGLKRITWFNEELRQFANLRQDPVSFTLANGQVRVGTLIQPADAAFPPKNKPLIVWQEGGPGVAMFNAWATNVENPYSLLPTFGFPVLVVPVAGRPGYTPAVFNSLADRANFGAIDIDEQAEIVRQMIARGWTNKSKVGIVGCSYGGYFTWQSIIRHPDLYAAANPQCALVDTITEWTRGYDVLMPYLEGLPPYNNMAEYRQDSPIYNTDKIKTAVLSFHGSNDFLPVVQNENMHLQLYNRGLKVRMVKFMYEGHGLADANNQLYAAQEQLSWFRTYLKP
ncbi:peptidase S9 prolyl oligopeptidase [Oscillochloris trichoides DG-6]|uniref:Peptidase S9 prolyl oligopeptidase n=1 Tax=Oscillochloris trichoides DG-6 TaxID=765420 RepID=E1IBW2_9CHLR|nr:prolyl oligopeptidase family serine peptidase [Oscillochloris trichoides]EFO81342.1 peptidase S9 prolyl oligopeptidase [Oscillochloris trichoides DG-6]